MYTILYIANIHALDVWGKGIFICNKKCFSFAFFPFIPFAMQLFSFWLRHKTSATKLRYYGAPPFQGTCDTVLECSGSNLHNSVAAATSGVLLFSLDLFFFCFIWGLC